MTERRGPFITVQVIEHEPFMSKADLHIDEGKRQVVITFDEAGFQAFQENVGSKIKEGGHLEVKLKDHQ